ncbi:MAG TPA: hypothetical protein VHM02_02980 [Thermoanaerobaculia bacterium]|nr:hypothetical protein [Thermoanaerobaculia bacterium]
MTTYTSRFERYRRILYAAALLFAVYPSDGAELSYHHVLEWTGAGRDARAFGVQVFRGTEVEHALDLLVETPDGEHVILTMRLDVIAGRDRFRLHHEESGYWVEIERIWPVLWDGMSDFLATGNDDLEAAGRRGEHFEVVLRSSGGPLAEVTTPVLPPDEAFVFLDRNLASGYAGRTLDQELPARVGSALPFLEAIFGTQSVGSQLGPFVRLLRRQAEIPDEQVPSGAWRESRELKNGTKVTAPEHAALLARFESYEPPAE